MNDKARTNLLITDFEIDENKHEFLLCLKRYDKNNHWRAMGVSTTGRHVSKMEKACRWMSLSFRVFRERNRYDVILGWQQFLGMMVAALCRFFHVRKSFRIIVMTFIYKERKGLSGWLRKRFVSYAVNSEYVDKIILFGGG